MFSRGQFSNRVQHGVRRKFCRDYQTHQVFGHRVRTPRPIKEPINVSVENGHFVRWVNEYRKHGHKMAKINPVAFHELSACPELDPKFYGLGEMDKMNFQGVLSGSQSEGTVFEALQFLQQVYSEHISAEFSHLDSEEERTWFAEEMEQLPQQSIDDGARVEMLRDLLKSQTFDQFLAKKYPGLKRYGGEGAEGMMPFFRQFLVLCSSDSIEEIVIGMPHRGRLNILTGILNVPPIKLFAKLRGTPDFPAKFTSSGDVLSHIIFSSDIQLNNRNMHISVLYNPSHLEAVNPISMGKTRAKQIQIGDGDYSDSGVFGDKVINLQVHGDAGFAGQGINQECLNLSNVPHFEVGGTVHFVVNNQVGFTTPADRGRSSRYCTDLAKMIAAPVLHVNGDDPEAVFNVTKLAFRYQRTFRKDVFIDFNCSRKWGHNELDEPTFTNPLLYKVINSKESAPNQYANKLKQLGLVTSELVEEIVRSSNSWLNEQMNLAETYQPEDPCFRRQWSGYEQAQEVVTTWDTGVEMGILDVVGNQSVSHPSDFNVHPHLMKSHINPRRLKVKQKVNIDWATAEALAFGSLLYQGYNVRISGQDVGRGTFSHRHAMLVDQKTNNIFIPLNAIHPDQKGFLEIANSILSEEAVLGYEYGMSVDSPTNLIVWEAQFGDFFNGAQIIFDTCISAGEAKWLWSSGIVILLPHGYDGAGPEHSSARIERFLQLTDSKEDRVDGDNVNMQVCQPSTPAQYFHLLRRQMIRNFRKPLIVIAPKTLLRLAAATSDLKEMTPGTMFVPVIDDTVFDHSVVKTIVFCSGKHYYNLFERRVALKVDDVALIRVESFCPFPTMEIHQLIAKYPNAKQFVWSQEEPRNMGAWSFIKPRFENLIGHRISYCGRETSAAPAVGVAKWHQQQAEDVIMQPFMLARK